MPTRSGYAAAVAAIGLLGLGRAMDAPELVAVAASALAALLLAVGWLLTIRIRLDAEREIRPDRVSVGAEARGFLTITNVGQRRCAPTTVTEALEPTPIALPVPALAPGESHHGTYPLATQRRGVYQIGPLTVTTCDPFRLARVARHFTAQSTLVVHPRIHDVSPVPTGLNRSAEGLATGSAPRGGVVFHGLREYGYGDDWRQIHWKSTARLGALMVRDNVVPDVPRTVVVLDTSTAPYIDESFEHAVSAAASLCAASVRRGFPLTLRTTGGAVATVDRNGDGTPVLDLLAGVARSAADPGLGTLALLGGPEAEGATLGVVTGQPDPAGLAVLPVVRRDFLAVSVVQFTGARSGSEPDASPALQGVVRVCAAEIDEFVALWNRRVPR